MARIMGKRVSGCGGPMISKSPPASRAASASTSCTANSVTFQPKLVRAVHPAAPASSMNRKNAASPLAGANSKAVNPATAGAPQEPACAALMWLRAATLYPNSFTYARSIALRSGTVKVTAQIVPRVGRRSFWGVLRVTWLLRSVNQSDETICVAPARQAGPVSESMLRTGPCTSANFLVIE